MAGSLLLEFLIVNAVRGGEFPPVVQVSQGVR
jgi:hypothetical protein